MDPHLSLIDLGEENGVEVDRPDSIVDLLQPDELLLQGIGWRYCQMLWIGSDQAASFRWA